MLGLAPESYDADAYFDSLADSEGSAENSTASAPEVTYWADSAYPNTTLVHQEDLDWIPPRRHLDRRVEHPEFQQRCRLVLYGPPRLYC